MPKKMPKTAYDLEFLRLSISAQYMLPSDIKSNSNAQNTLTHIIRIKLFIQVFILWP